MEERERETEGAREKYLWIDQFNGPIPVYNVLLGAGGHGLEAMFDLLLSAHILTNIRFFLFICSSISARVVQRCDFKYNNVIYEADTPLSIYSHVRFDGNKFEK